jgi:cysteine desulfurase
MREPVYLDHNATSPMLPEVLAAMQPCFEGTFGNPSSMHAPGREARRVVEEARRGVHALLGGAPGDVIFTGSGTEAVFLGMVGAARARRSAGSHVVVSAIEHRSGLDAADRLAAEGCSVRWVAPDPRGRIEPERVAQALRSDTILVSVLHANNETGVMQPLEEIGALARSVGAGLHVDAVQSAGKMRLDPDAWKADYVSIAAHKLGGPKGVGALWRRSGSPLHPIVPGTQERGLHGGTLNVPAVVGFGRAADLAGQDLASAERKMLGLRTFLELRVATLVPGAVVTGGEAERLPNTTHLTFDPEIGPDLVIALDRAGYAVSAGSACQSGSEAPSHVLLAMGMTPDRARTAVRVSLGPNTSEADLEGFVTALRDIVDARLGASAGR